MYSTLYSIRTSRSPLSLRASGCTARDCLRGWAACRCTTSWLACWWTHNWTAWRNIHYHSACGRTGWNSRLAICCYTTRETWLDARVATSHISGWQITGTARGARLAQTWNVACEWARRSKKWSRFWLRWNYRRSTRTLLVTRCRSERPGAQFRLNCWRVRAGAATGKWQSRRRLSTRWWSWCWCWLRWDYRRSTRILLVTRCRSQHPGAQCRLNCWRVRAGAATGKWQSGRWPGNGRGLKRRWRRCGASCNFNCGLDTRCSCRCRIQSRPSWRLHAFCGGVDKLSRRIWRCRRLTVAEWKSALIKQILKEKSACMKEIINTSQHK